nr:pentatricopeptide repeat protein AaPPR1122 [Agave angustifolia]
MYAKCGDICSAVSLFDQMPQRNIVTWTALITGYSQNNRFSEAIQTFSSMHSSGIRPTQFALSSSIQALASLRVLTSGKQLHAMSLKLGFDAELFVGSNLADMYSKCGCLTDACQVFEAMPLKDEVSWTAMIDGYAKNGDLEQALAAFRNLLGQGVVVVDQHVFCSVLSACGGLKACEQGKSVHSLVLKMGFDCEEVIGNALIDMYSKSGEMASALSVASSDSMGWNVVTCSSLIDGYVEMDQIDEALTMFVESRRCGIEPNEFTFSSLIKACAGQAMLEQGSQLHTQVIKTSFVFDPFVSAVLVDMYGKCGVLNSSIQMFEEIKTPNDFAWNSIMGVLAQHGRGNEALQTFNRMVLTGIKPNHVTFVNVLMACSHSGLVKEGLEYFDSMNKIYGIEPREEHYSCVIDLLGRAGRLEEAEEFISRMPVEPNAFGWCSLLGACRTHKAKQLGELAAEKLMKLEPENSGLHVLLSDIYASAGQWEYAKAMRKLMRDSGVRKLPGFSNFVR